MKIIRRLKKAIGIYIPKKPIVPQPIEVKGRVIITGLGPGEFHGPGKVQPNLFFPDFCIALKDAGIETKFVTTAKELSDEINDNCCVIHIYREVSVRIDTDDILNAQTGAKLVFNHPCMGPIIARKNETHHLLTRHGIKMPSMSNFSNLVFSNSLQDSGADVQLLHDTSKINHERYNTEFIDTSVSYKGKSYYTTVRIMCIGEAILHAYVRARDLQEGSPSVHAHDTPLDPILIEHLQLVLVDENFEKLKLLTAKISRILGPGFYSHDILIDNVTKEIYLCETGFKFNDWAYTNRLAPIIKSLDSHKWMKSALYAKKSSELFLSECKRLSVFN